MLDVIIIGNGPAGTSCAIYTSRNKLDTLVLSHQKSPLPNAGLIENYYGFENGIDGKNLFESGVLQAKRFGTKFANETVISIEKRENGININTDKNSYETKSLLFATGNPPIKPAISKLTEFEGRGVAYCATCDGFFYTNANVGILGYTDFAIHEAIAMSTYTKNITIFTNGRELIVSDKFKKDLVAFSIDKSPISKLVGENELSKIEFKDGQTKDIDGLFVAYGTASSLDFAKKMGIITENDLLETDKKQMTNIDGIFAAGACTCNCKGFNQIATSVGQGALAAKYIIQYLGKENLDKYGH